MIKNKRKPLLLFFTLILAGLGGYAIEVLTRSAPEIIPSESSAFPYKLDEKRDGGYAFINPLLECDSYQPSQLNSVVQMQSKIENYIQTAQNSKKATAIAVYFRDLNYGPWMGINERQNFSPASLLKVPLMIALLKKAEKDPLFLKKKTIYSKHLEKIANPNIIDTNQLQIGKSYTVETLIERMIEHSDNEAKEMLLLNIDESFFAKVTRDIGVNTSGDLSKDFVSVKDYSGFFRLLYNATYLNREMSEKALEILSRTTFDKGIVNGLPKGTLVSHKFGERAYTNFESKQLHDCGIVYVSGSPYLLCIMTQGSDFNQLTSVLSDISAIVYKEVVAQ